jgi:hypothetical protein
MRRRYNVVLLTGILFLILLPVNVSAECECANPANLNSTFAGGDGSAGNPYVICTAGQLNNVRNYLSSHFIVKKDIDLSGYSSWQPIAHLSNYSFGGFFDGNHCRILNLTINRPSAQFAGLFGFVSNCTLQNVRLVNVDIVGGTYAGALFGYGTSNTSITQCSSSGIVTGTGNNPGFAGGLIGSMMGANIAISESYSTCAVTGVQQIGGLFATIISTGTCRIENCYATGAVSGGIYTSGGLISRLNTTFPFTSDNSLVIQNCYSSGQVGNTNYHYNGGLIGASDGANITVTSSFWDTQTRGQSASAGGTGETTAEMLSGETFTGWDFADIWNISEGSDYPRLRMEPLNGSCGVPTLIELTSFAAGPDNSAIILAWSSASEIDTAGFNLYRAESQNGSYMKINASLIPAEGSAAEGAAYEFVDKEVKNRKTYYYKLEDIDLNGVSTLHGPVRATQRLRYGKR